MNFASKKIKIGNLIIEGFLPGDIPSVVAGKGLGNAKGFSPAFIQRFMYFAEGSPSPSLDEKEGIKITTNNDNTKITAMSVKPLFGIVGQNDTTKWAFPIRYRLSGTGSLESDRYQTLDPTASPIAINIPSPAAGIQMDISTDTNYATVFTGYLDAHNHPSVG